MSAVSLSVSAAARCRLRGGRRLEWPWDTKDTGLAEHKNGGGAAEEEYDIEIPTREEIKGWCPPEEDEEEGFCLPEVSGTEVPGTEVPSGTQLGKDEDGDGPAGRERSPLPLDGRGGCAPSGAPTGPRLWLLSQGRLRWRGNRPKTSAGGGRAGPGPPRRTRDRQRCRGKGRMIPL